MTGIFHERESRNMGGGVYAPSREQAEAYRRFVERKIEELHVSDDNDTLHELFLATVGNGDVLARRVYEEALREEAERLAYEKFGFAEEHFLSL